MRERLFGLKQLPVKAAPPTCPHLGLGTDPFKHLAEASPEHRCYLWMQRERIDLAHQKRFCLTQNHTGCPWLSVAPATTDSERSGGRWQRFGAAVREHFDELEHRTLRASWPEAIVAVAEFTAQVTAQLFSEARRVVAPAVDGQIQKGRQAIGSASQQPSVSSVDSATEGAATNGAPAASTAATAARPVSAAPNAIDAQVLAKEAGAMSHSSTNSLATDATTTENARSAGPRGGRISSAVAGSPARWDCAFCFAYNPANATFCHQCGRLSPLIEEELAAREEFVVLDGIRLLKAGEEEQAHRFFTLATQNNPTSDLAWYWRARTADTLDEVIQCLEQMLQLDPENEQARLDLETARRRREHEEVLAVARAQAQTLAAAGRRKQPSMARRALTVVRRLALEAASIPSFVLALLLIGQPIADALAAAGVSGILPVVPEFRLPTLMVSLPAEVVEPLIPSTLDLAPALPYVFALWYLWLAFQLADGLGSMRLPAVLSGAIVFAALPYLVTGTVWFAVLGVILGVLALVGLGRGQQPETAGVLVTSSVR